LRLEGQPELLVRHLAVYRAFLLSHLRLALLAADLPLHVPGLLPLFPVALPAAVMRIPGDHHDGPEDERHGGAGEQSVAHGSVFLTPAWRPFLDAVAHAEFPHDLGADLSLFRRISAVVGQERKNRRRRGLLLLSFPFPLG
jgi:hypothetical protein